ncbi:MAG: Uma2 family endonuclease [Hyphomonadaceae bacterium]|nr:Uma2 family endonuclease [Hyphomonadaceae bacterium]
MEDGFISYHTRPNGQRYFTNADMARMVEQGLIDPEDRWELIRGAWFEMGSEGFEHMDARTALVHFFSAALGFPSSYRVGSEGSIFFSHDTELRPDLIIYRADITSNEMSGDDIFLVAEIMKTSQHRDMELKRPIYARAGVPELWLIDLDEKRVHVLRTPDTEQAIYREQRSLGFEDAITALAFPEISLRLADLVK